MIEQIKAGDKLTVIKVNSLAATSINEITIDSIQDGKAIFAAKRKKYYLSADNNVLVLRGHNLGITHGSWNNGGSCFIMSGNCNLGGLDREKMIALLKNNINPLFDGWQKIYWFDGTSEEGDPLFVPRPVSDNYLRHREEAEQNKAKPAGQINVGDFIYSFLKGSKFDNLTDMLKYHLTLHDDFSESIQLGKIVDIIEMSDEEFDSMKYMERNNLLKDEGGDFTDDLAEGCDTSNLSEFERETFYSHFTLIRTPSGRAITVDAQGYDYMRYTGLLTHYRESMAVDCAKVQQALSVECEELKKEEQAKKIEAAQQEQAEKIRIEKEYAFLTVATEFDWQKTAANNLRALLKHKFPTTKFSVRKHYYDSYIVDWNDGPPESAVREITRLFKDQGWDSMTDSSYPISTPFNERYGGIGSIATSREISQAVLDRELELLNKELDKRYRQDDYVVERDDTAIRVVYRIAHKKDYSPVVEQKPNTKSETKPPKPSVPVIMAEGLEIIDYSEKSFAVIGDTKPIKETLKQLGGCFNGRLTCGVGWIFAKTKLDTVKQTLSIV